MSSSGVALSSHLFVVILSLVVAHAANVPDSTVRKLLQDLQELKSDEHEANTKRSYESGVERMETPKLRSKAVNTMLVRAEKPEVVALDRV